MNRRRWGLVGVAAAGFAACSPQLIAAQVCIGFPTAVGQGAVAVTAGFPNAGNDFGAELGYHMQWGASAFGGVNVHTVTGGENVTSFGGGAAFAVPELRASLPVGLYSCPTVSLNVATGRGLDDNIVSVPVGLGLGTIVPLGPTMTMSPYIVPQLRWTTSGGATSTDWVATGGAIILGFLGPRVYAGATLNRVFVEGARSVFGVKAGVTF